MLRIMERVYLLADGQIRYEGPATNLLNDPAAQQAYFGHTYGIHRDRARLAAEEELRRISHVDEAELSEPQPRPPTPKGDDDAPAR